MFIAHLHHIATVYNWVNDFKRGRTSTCDAPHPIEAATSEIIDKVHDFVLTDRRVKVRELVEATSISHDFNFTRTIGYEKAIGKMDAAFVTVNHKRDRVTISKQDLKCFNVIQIFYRISASIHYFG